MRPVLFAAILLAGCSGVPRATDHGSVLDLWKNISTSDDVRVRGVGMAPPEVWAMTAVRGQSRDAALADARLNLLATIKSVKISGGVTVAQLMEKDSLVSELANDLVNGGEEVLTEFTRDGGAVVTLELRRSTVERLIQEKSDRERGLERRIARDVREIKDLNDLLSDALDSGLKDADPDELVALREKAQALVALKVAVKASEARYSATNDHSAFILDGVGFLAEIGRIKAMDPRKMSEEAREQRRANEDYAKHEAASKRRHDLDDKWLDHSITDDERVELQRLQVDINAY